MKKQTSIAGSLLILAAIGFWISWFLMPDPGTTNTNHILSIVKQSRTSVLFSVIIQLSSSVLYAVALLLMARIITFKKTAWSGVILFGIGVLGLCSDAFFHLLAWFMTDSSVTIQDDVVRVMNFMQTKGLIFLVPLLLPFFIGNMLLSFGLNKQVMISKLPQLIFSVALLAGVASAVISKIPGYSGSVLTITAISLFTAGQAMIGFELMNFYKKESRVFA